MAKNIWLKMLSLPLMLVAIFIPAQLWYFIGGWGGTIFDRFGNLVNIYHPMDVVVAVFLLAFTAMAFVYSQGKTTWLISLFAVNDLTFVFWFNYKFGINSDLFTNTLLVTIAMFVNFTAALVFYTTPYKE